MKLLFDENLDDKLPHLLRDLYPGSAHVYSLKLTGGGDDRLIWDHAADFDFVVTSKDKDFLDLSARFGAPPKLILVTLGNAATSRVESDLRTNYGALQEFASSNAPVFYLG